MRFLLASLLIAFPAAVSRAEPTAHDSGVAPGSADAASPSPSLTLFRTSDRKAAFPYQAYLDGYELRDSDLEQPLPVAGRVSLVVRSIDAAGNPYLDDWQTTLNVTGPVVQGLPVPSVAYLRGEWMAPMIVASLFGAALVGVAVDRTFDTGPGLDPTGFYAAGSSLLGASFALAIPAFWPENVWRLQVRR